MGLKDLFDNEKARLAAPEEKEKVYYNANVLPLVERLVAQINEDPDFEATFKKAGDTEGLATSNESKRAWWIFDIQFKNKSTGASEGAATLKLNAGEPRYVSPSGADMGTEEGRQKVIGTLVREAAE